VGKVTDGGGMFESLMDGKSMTEAVSDPRDRGSDRARA
jgi:hypothetical protein